MTHMAVTDFIRAYPEYQRRYLTQKWYKNIVGNSYGYDESVCSTNLYAYYGVFMELFIRKCLCSRFNIACTDGRTYRVLQKYKIRNRSLRSELSEAYAAYCDPCNRAIDIVESIKMVALAYRIIHWGELENMQDIYNMYIDYGNLKEVVRFINRLPYGHMVYKQPCNLEFYNHTLYGVPDFVFDGNVFCKITTSMYSTSYRKKMGKLVLYIVSHYGQNYFNNMEENNYEIMIYNPLLNEKYTTYILMTPSIYMDMRDEIEADLDNLNY